MQILNSNFKAINNSSKIKHVFPHQLRPFNFPSNPTYLCSPVSSLRPNHIKTGRKKYPKTLISLASMAADVSTRDLVTRDFLSYAVIGSKELDLDLKVPSGWERRLDLLSGETYLEKTGSKSKNLELHDLNLPPPQNDNSTLDLKLLLPSCPRPNYQSVCTLDKVRLALERAGRESQGKKRTGGSESSTSSSKRSLDLDETTDGSDSSAGFMAAGCPSCLMYVLISKGNPRCPRCDSHVPAPAAAGFVKKKAKIDLNLL